MSPKYPKQEPKPAPKEVTYAYATVEYHVPDKTNWFMALFKRPHGYIEYRDVSRRRRVRASKIGALRVKLIMDRWGLLRTTTEQRDGWTVTNYEYE